MARQHRDGSPKYLGASLPTTWRMCSLGDICEESQYGINPSQGEGHAYPMLRMNNLQGGRVDTSDLAHVTLSDEQFAKYRLHQGDLLINRTNSVDLVGKTALFDLPGDYVFASYLVRFRVRREEAIPQYVSYFCNSSPGQYAMRRLATKGVSQANINPTELKKRLIIPLPPLPEQHRIAEILGTWDEAIALTERLIEAKRRLKKGLMQQLLTGKRRFPEFAGQPWREVRLRDICKSMRSGGTPSTNEAEYWTGDIPWITGADFDGLGISQVRRHITQAAVTESATMVAGRGNILLVTRTGVGKMAIAPFDVAISQDITCLELRDEITDAAFLVHMLQWRVPVLAALNQGTSISGVTRKDVGQLTLALPRLEEQHRISSVLATCDEETDLLTRKWQALQQQKKGLMRQLLTGNVHVTPKPLREQSTVHTMGDGLG